MFVCLSVMIILHTTFYSIALSKCNSHFTQCEVKSCIIAKNLHHQKTKTIKGVCTSQASHWTALHCLGFAVQKWHQKVCVSSPVCSHYSSNAATTQTLSFTWLQQQIVAIVSTCLGCVRDVAGLYIITYKSGYSHRSEDCSMYVNHSSAFSLSTHPSCLLPPGHPVHYSTAGMRLKHQLWILQTTIDG